MTNRFAAALVDWKITHIVNYSTIEDALKIAAMVASGDVAALTREDWGKVVSQTRDIYKLCIDELLKGEK